MAVPKKRRSKFKVNLHRFYSYFNVQRFFIYKKPLKKFQREDNLLIKNITFFSSN